MIIYKAMRTMQTPGHGQNILWVFMKQFQHVSGLSLPLLKYPDQQAPYLEGYFYVYLHKLLTEHDCKLEFACVDSPTVEQENNILIMNLAYSKTRDQSYLQIPRLSDICTANRSYIMDTVLNSERII